MGKLIHSKYPIRKKSNRIKVIHFGQLGRKEEIYSGKYVRKMKFGSGQNLEKRFLEHTQKGSD